MKTIYWKISAILFVLFALTTQTGYAQAPLVEASIDRYVLSTNELLTLTIVVNTDSTTLPKVALPPLDNFSVIRTDKVSQTKVVNGQLAVEFIYEFVLHPLDAGELVIDSAEVEVDGQIYYTTKFNVEVQFSPPDGAPSNTPAQQGQEGTEPTEDVFVELEVDNKNPYLGEQVIYTHRLFTTFRLGNQQPAYDFPRFTGFAREEEPVVTDRTYRIKDQVYQVRETKIILFPTRTGLLNIEETIVSLPDGVLRPGFSVASDRVEMEVKPQPPNAPENYAGAVGLFTIDAELSNTQGRVDEPLTLLVTLTGQGNISAAPDPDWPDMPEWRVFEAQSSTTTEFQNNHLIGRRVYERLMVPGSAGNYIVPAITYAYFDPALAEYRTISTDPIQVEVVAGPNEPPPPLVISGNKAEIERLGTDIRHIKPVPTYLSAATASLTTKNLYWSAWAAPLLLLALSFIWARRRQYLGQNSARRRSQRAHKQAKRAIRQVRKGNGDWYRAAGQILTTYLAAKLNHPVAGLTQAALAELLEQWKIDGELIERIQTALMQSDMGRFGPGGGALHHDRQLLDRVERLIDALEEVF